MDQTKALVILSGGQDSTTCLFVAIKEHGVENVRAIFFNYGQKHIIEQDAAIFIASMAGIPLGVIDCKGILHSVSPLIDRTAELEKYTDAKQMAEVIGDRVELTFVPMRNALFLTIAANRAVEHGCGYIYTGVCQEDNANYPDCRQSFIEAAETYINQALGKDGPIIRTPLMNLSKAETCKLAATMPKCWEALAFSHTSYDGKYPPTDMNHANVLRAQGFEEAGLPDPLVVRAWGEGLMELPKTSNYEEIVRNSFVEGATRHMR